MDSFFEDVYLAREPSESCKNYLMMGSHDLLFYTTAGSDMGKLLPKQLNADKQLNVDQGFHRVLSPHSQSDVQVVSSEANSAVGSIWKKSNPRNPQIHKSPSLSKSECSITETPQTIPEGRVVNIDEAIACRNSIHHSNGKLDRHGDGNRNHRILGDGILLDHHLGVAVDSSNSSLEEHVFKNYFDNSWDQLRQKKLSQHEPVMDGLDVTNTTRAQSVTSSYSTHLESDL